MLVQKTIPRPVDMTFENWRYHITMLATNIRNRERADMVDKLIEEEEQELLLNEAKYALLKKAH